MFNDEMENNEVDAADYTLRDLEAEIIKSHTIRKMQIISPIVQYEVVDVDKAETPEFQSPKASQEADLNGNPQTPSDNFRKEDSESQEDIMFANLPLKDRGSQVFS